MHDKDDFLKNIPPFLRRTQEPLPRPAAAQTETVPAQTETAPATAETAPPPAAKATAELPPVPAVKPGSLPWLAQRKAAVKEAAPAPVVSAAVEKPVPKAIKAPNAVRESQSRIERELSREAVAEPAPGEADAPFQVTLPRGVIRQIRIRAAEEGTTHRAIVLRALRLAGLSVPEGLDVDRRKPTVQQRQTA
jgi:hypothetical protein